MLYQITRHGWPIAAHLIPVGTVINSNSTDQWSALARGHPPPLNAMPLDWETWQELKRLYPD